MRLVIVGGVAAGTKAASRARRLDPDMGITVYQEEPEPSISECGLPYSPLRRRRGTREAHRPHPRTVRQEEHRGTGAPAGREHRPRCRRTPRPRPGKRTRSSRTLTTACPRHRRAGRPPPYPWRGPRRHLRAPLPHRRRQNLEYVEDNSPKRAVVVGGGYIGLEVAENLCGLGMEVGLVEAEKRVALAYGAEVSEKIEAQLREPRRPCLHRHGGGRVHRRRPRAGVKFRRRGA